MGFHEVQFPLDISYGSVGGPRFNTAVIETDSGQEERVVRWNGGRMEFNARYGVRDQDALHDLVKFHRERQGRAYGFRYKDFMDFTTATDGKSAPDDEDVSIATGDGSTLQFQLVKKYTDAVVTRTRNITKPVANTTVVAVDGTPQTDGVDFTVNTTNGIVTFTVAPADTTDITAGCEFDVPVRFADDFLEVSHDSFEAGTIPDIPLIELLSEIEIQDEFWYGGAKDHGSISADISITLGDGLVHRVTPSGAGLAVILPAITNIPPGAPTFIIGNDGGTALAVNRNDDTLLISIPAGSEVEIFVSINAANVKSWHAGSV